MRSRIFKTIFWAFFIILILIIINCSEEKTIYSTNTDYDTVFVNMPDTIFIMDTIEPVPDTIFVDIYDTIQITDTIGPIIDTEFVNISDTIYITDTIESPPDTVLVNIHDTTYVIDTIESMPDTIFVGVYDTVQVTDTIGPIFDTIFVNIHDTTYVTDTIESPPDTVLVSIHDTTFVTDTIGPILEDEWLGFSAYLASIEFVKENYPARAEDRFSSFGQYCDYASHPAGRAGFLFEEQPDGSYLIRGYTFEYLFGAEGYVWGAAQGEPTENTYSYTCYLQYEGDGQWSLLQISMSQAGNYIRDTRHD